MLVKRNLLASTAIVAVALAVATPALAGNTANLDVGSGPAALAPTAGQTITVGDNTTNAIWDATEGVGAADVTINFPGGGGGAASIKLEDSTGVGSLLIGNVSVTDDASASTVNIDGTSGAVTVVVAGNVSNADNVGNNDVVFQLEATANAATLVFESSSAQTIEANVRGTDGAEGALVVNNSHADGAIFVNAIGVGEGLASITVGNTNADSKVTFRGDVTATTLTLGDGANANSATVVFEANTADTTFTGAIAGTASDTTVLTFQDTNTTALNKTTVTGDVGTGTAIGTINVGNATAAGSAVFQGTVSATNINVNATSGASSATFGNISGATDAVTATTITLTGGATAGRDASATFNGNVASAIVLDDGTAGTATVTFDNVTAADNTVTGTIKGGSDGEGALVVTNSIGSNKVSFASAIGGDSLSLKSVTIGNDTHGGTAEFAGAVNATTVTVSGSAANASGTFASTLTAGTGGIKVTAGTGTSALSVTGAVSSKGDILVSSATGKAASASFSDTVSVDSGSGTVTASSSSDTAATVTFNKAVTAKVSLNSAAGTDAVAIFAGNSAYTVSGKVSPTTTGTGVVTVSNTDTGGVTFTSAVGSSTAKLATVNVNGYAVFESGLTATNITFDDAANVAAATVKGDISATTITLDNAGANGSTLTLAASGSQSVAGDFVGVGVGQGVLNVGSGSTATKATFSGDVGYTGNDLATIAVKDGAEATFNGKVGVTNLTIGSGTGTGTATFAKDLTVTGTSTLDGTLTFSGTTALGTTANIGVNQNSTITLANAVTAQNTVTFGSAGKTVTLNLKKTDDFDPDTTTALAATGNVTVTGGLKVGIDSGSQGIANGSVLTVITSGGGTNLTGAVVNDAASLVDGKILLVDSATIDLQNHTGTSTATQLDVKVVYKTNVDGASGPASTALTNALTATQNDAEAFYALAGLNSGNSQAAGSSLLPNTAGQTAVATVGAARGAVGAVNARLAAARSGTQVAGLQQTGVAAGDGTRDKGAWAKGYGSWADQGSRGGVAGFDADTYGVAVGIDNKFTKDIRAGLSFAYSNTDVDGKDVGKSKTDIDSYQLTLYGSYEPGAYFIEGSVGYAINKADTTRQVTVGGLNRTAKGSYDADQYTANLAAGMPIKKDAFTFTPKAGLFYSYVNPDKYTETGAGGLNLDVDPESVAVLEGSVGVTAAYTAKVQGGTLVPEARAGLLYDFIGDEAATAAKFTGGGATFNTDGLEPAQFGGRLGVGLGFNTADGVYEVRADYDAELRADYTSHTGMLTGRINF